MKTLAAIAIFLVSSIMQAQLLDRLQEAAQTAQAVPERFEGGACAIMPISINSVTIARMDTLSCNTGSPSYLYVDFYRLALTSGAHVKIVLASAALSPLFMTIQRLSDGIVLTFVTGNTPQTIDYFAPYSGDFIIGVSSLKSFATGEYMLSAQQVTSGGTCTTNSTTQCLQNGRFSIRVNWRAPAQGTFGTATAIPMTGDTGYFWFFNSANVELVLKVLDGRAINGRFWVFYGALSNVEYTITITDTQTGATRTYFNPNLNLASVADTSAFQ